MDRKRMRTYKASHQTNNTIMRHLSEGTRIAGTAVPVFSLRTKGSFGVGDFGDLKQMIKWVANTKQGILQILPINDTTATHTWTDSYPYSCISIYALHPQYCDLRQLPRLKDAKKQAHFDGLQQQLNALPQIDYEAVNNAKIEFLSLLYAQEGKEICASTNFKDFVKAESLWLKPYGEFCLQHNIYPTTDVNFVYYIQFILDRQMREAHEYAREMGVMLKGDIPIGVNRHGCDAWAEPRYFNMNGQAGAPPDNFSANGQNWGFPTYNWDEMLKDGCQWWIRRFQNMAKYFDAYRIDHVLGFFRIWEIPLHSVHGLLGQFSPALAMSRQEIEHYGLYLSDEFMTEPFIADWVIDRFFPGKQDMVKEQFLVHTHDDIWKMKPEFDTQRKVEKYFVQKTTTGKDGKTQLTAGEVALRDGLYSLISNVLFVRDHRNPQLFHPRIAAQLDPVYETLWQHDKDNFNRLYNDYYYRRNNQFWYEEAMKKLPKLVDATDMLVCAEDLGMVPDCVPWVLNKLQILSLELQSMPKDSSLKFGILAKNPWRSVCTISSHDSATMRMWWDEDWQRSQEYYNGVLGYEGAAPHPMPEWLADDIVMRHLECPSALCILTIQDWLACSEKLRLADANAERINIPANPRHYWRYRMHLNIEDLIAANDFNEKLRGMIRGAGR
ncbi:MAG: 4-alpha-glucanotransferase [Bacteroidaceae bacterium]|nr:4-alpha-glucanotransferase [Bacteroidaceae bacterium]